MCEPVVSEERFLGLFQGSDVLLLSWLDDIPVVKLAEDKGRIRVVRGLVFENRLPSIVGIAILASVCASIERSDVDARNAPANRTLSRVFSRVKRTTDDSLD